MSPQADSVPLPRALVAGAQSDAADPWTLGNQALYALCRSHGHHRSVGEIVSKVWLIGRAYAATVERGRSLSSGSALANDAFYIQRVAPALQESDLDDRLAALACEDTVSEDNIAAILETHYALVLLLFSLTGTSKRSFASKYLHFHLPAHFFIYDSRAVAALHGLGIRGQRLIKTHRVDRDYARFAAAMLHLRQRVIADHGVTLSPRQLDRILLTVHEGNPDSKEKRASAPNDAWVLDEFTRIRLDGATTVFEILSIEWPIGPHTPESHWIEIERTKTELDRESQQLRRLALLQRRKYFRICTRCGQRKPSGSMHDNLSCHACSERFDGVVY